MTEWTNARFWANMYKLCLYSSSNFKPSEFCLKQNIESLFRLNPDGLQMIEGRAWTKFLILRVSAVTLSWLSGLRLFTRLCWFGFESRWRHVYVVHNYNLPVLCNSVNLNNSTSCHVKEVLPITQREHYNNFK